VFQNSWTFLIDKGTLTISEQPGFAGMGTAFNFVPDHDKLKFEANVNSINEAGLKASSKLLKLAIIVN
jgi:YfiR/HmsC-like